MYLNQPEGMCNLHQFYFKKTLAVDANVCVCVCDCLFVYVCDVCVCEYVVCKTSFFKTSNLSLSHIAQPVRADGRLPRSGVCSKVSAF